MRTAYRPPHTAYPILHTIYRIPPTAHRLPRRISGGKRLRKSLADNGFSAMDYPNYGPRNRATIPRRCHEKTYADNRRRKQAASAWPVAGRSNFTAGRKSVRQRTLRPHGGGRREFMGR